MQALGRWPSPQSPFSALPLHATRWLAALRPALRRLGQALTLAVRTLGRWLVVIAGHADYLVAGRGRVLSPLESNPP
ncbi:hypothetical protein SAMN05216344_10585 [Polaromonas sp. OV174]|uniref:hypothetical protein n=1 Tax=Polaromonas sp. OV174 TaxID=1855300 RepID=UPI0008EB9B03|nr:hypothetical protein [Polaromonas sp. OV174]SFB90638.1 hypothetical protein SAMN05216344_10585 [Polaromonas sp. OV174]